jgi:hypothetical protein
VTSDDPAAAGGERMTNFLASPFVYHSEFRLKPEHAIVGDPSHLAPVANAHQQSDDAYPISVYVSWLGEQPKLHFFTPLASRADMDSHPRQQEFADADALSSLAEAVESQSNSLLTHVPDHSTHEPSNGASPLIYHTELTIRPEAAVVGDAGPLQRYADAHRSSDDGLPFATFYNWLGEAPTLHLFTPLSQYGDMDGLKRWQEIVEPSDLQAFGQDFSAVTNSILVHLEEYSMS